MPRPSSTLSSDGRTLYLMLFDVPRAEIGVRGLVTPVRRVTVLGTGVNHVFGYDRHLNLGPVGSEVM